jgi:UDP-2,3-diacylglucosamine pyrophosphatase LpxH
MDVMPILPDTELEATAAQHLGRLLFVFGGLELHLDQTLVNVRPPAELESEAARVEKLAFGDKLDELASRVQASHAGDAKALARWQKWFLAANTLRELRNRFAHGRWGFQHYHQQVVHVRNLPGSGNQEEVRFTLDEFAAHVASTEEVAEEFTILRDLHSVDACHETVIKNP